MARLTGAWLTDVYLLPVKIIIKASTKNGVKTNNMPIQVINIKTPPKLFMGPAHNHPCACFSCNRNNISRCDIDYLYHSVIYNVQSIRFMASVELYIGQVTHMGEVDDRLPAAQEPHPNRSEKATAATLLRGIPLQNCNAWQWSTFGDLKNEYPAEQCKISSDRHC
jgi:hypothetical protein